MRYDAFISYRHSDLDMEIAKKVHSGLETYKIPRSVQKSLGKKKMGRVFRDQEELPIGSDLDDNIESALKESESLKLRVSFQCLCLFSQVLFVVFQLLFLLKRAEFQV